MEQIQRKTRRLELVLGPEDGGVKVDTLLRRRLHLSGTVIRRIKWLPDGILVDGARVNTAFRPREGQTLSVRLSDPERRSGILPAPGPLDIVYEDGDLLILNKAPGVPVHPGPGHFNDTIGNFLLNYYNSEGIEGDFHPVHRLDRGTSGLMAVAKHPHAQEVLKGQLHTPAFRRVWGPGRAPWWSRWSAPTARTPAHGMRPCPAPGGVPWSVWSWTPGAPTRSGSTWPLWAAP